MNDDRELDRLLDTLKPPAPSETLQARLLRDFAPMAAAPAGAPPSPTVWRRSGPLAVAAALVLAVGIGILTPGQRLASNIRSDVYDVVPADEEDVVREVFAEAPPDSAAFMVATFSLGGRYEDGTPGESGFEGLPLD
jgi:hypothetical protein